MGIQSPLNKTVQTFLKVHIRPLQQDYQEIMLSEIVHGQQYMNTKIPIQYKGTQ